MSRLRRSYQLTCILVSHDFGVVAHLCNRIAIMQQGRLVELLDVEALRRSEAKEPYTQELIAASRGFTRALRHTLRGNVAERIRQPDRMRLGRLAGRFAGKVLRPAHEGAEF